MTNEQKEAIEKLNRFKTIKILYGNTFAMHIEQLEKVQEAIETTLNLIKQQERKIYDYDEIIARLEEENTRKNKMIDLIAEKLAKTYHYTPKKCSLKEDIDCNNYKNCTDCAKQYFERKVRE